MSANDSDRNESDPLDRSKRASGLPPWLEGLEGPDPRTSDDAPVPTNLDSATWSDLPESPDYRPWAEWPKLDVCEQMSGSMSFRFPTPPAVPGPPLPTSGDPPELMPAPPFVRVVNDDLGALSQLRSAKLAGTETAS